MELKQAVSLFGVRHSLRSEQRLLAEEQSLVISAHSTGTQGSVCSLSYMTYKEE